MSRDRLVNHFCAACVGDFVLAASHLLQLQHQSVGISWFSRVLTIHTWCSNTHTRVRWATTRTYADKQWTKDGNRFVKSRRVRVGVKPTKRTTRKNTCDLLNTFVWSHLAPLPPSLFLARNKHLGSTLSYIHTSSDAISTKDNDDALLEMRFSGSSLHIVNHSVARGRRKQPQPACSEDICKIQQKPTTNIEYGIGGMCLVIRFVFAQQNCETGLLGSGWMMVMWLPSS